MGASYSGKSIVCIPSSERHSDQLQQVLLGWLCFDHGARRKAEDGNFQKSESSMLQRGGEGCSQGIGEGHFEDHVIAMSVKNGLGPADLGLGPGDELGDLSLFSLTLQVEGEKKKKHLNIPFSLWIFSPSSLPVPSCAR